MDKLCDQFPVFSVNNFFPVDPSDKKNLIKKILENKKLFYTGSGYNFPILNDHKNFFKNLYKKFYNLCEQNFNFTPSENLSSICWSYVSDKRNFYESWHNHLNTSTINSVYYFNIPDNDYVTIDFELDGNIFTHKLNKEELIIFPNYLNHKPNRCYKNGYRISINMEIICKESSEYIFNNMR